MCGCERGTGRARLLSVPLALVLAACGGGDAPASTAPAGGGAVPGQAAGPQPAAPGGVAAAPGPSTAGAGAATAAGGVAGRRELAHPEDLQMVMLAYRLEGRQPPFAEWAAAQPGVRMANEFERADVLRAEEERLRAVYDGTEGVGLLRLNVRAALSEYDGGRGGYYLTAFTPGSVLTFTAYPVDRAHPERVSVRVDNPGELNFWPLDAATARGVLDRNGGLRNVVLDARMRITGISRRSDGSALSATLLGYTITSDRHGQPVVLGELRFDGNGG